MPPKVVLTLDRNEMGGLNTYAEQELRSARDQLRYILRKALQERGLLEFHVAPIGTPQSAPAPELEASHAG